MKRMGRAVVAALAAVGAVALLAAFGFLRSGVSARPEPSQVEAWLARTARNLAIPAAARARANPLPADAQGVADAGEHFLEHCAGCHGEDGRGDTEMGRALSPRAPDLTSEGTQSLSDGALFWIVENGIRLTGMPGFGTESPEDDAHAWALVHWIRRLPTLPLEAARPAQPAAGGHEGHSHSHERRRP